MPITFAVKGSVAIVTCEGEFNVEGAREIVDWLRKEASLPTKFKLLIDDHGTDFNPSTDQLVELAVIYSSIADRISRWAVVVEKKYQYGLGRMFSVIAERYGFEARPFEDMAEAEAWLDES